MTRTIIVSVLLVLATFVVPALAAQGSQSPAATVLTFEQKQESLMQLLDDRIASLQEERACVQSVRNEEDIKACIENYSAATKKQNGEQGVIRRKSKGK